MPNLMFRIGILIILMSLTWYFGYSSGVRNQFYFDAAGRAALYKGAISRLEKEEGAKPLEEFLFRQKCLLASDFNYETYTIHHPIHSQLLENYNLYKTHVCGDDGCTCKLER